MNQGHGANNHIPPERVIPTESKYMYILEGGVYDKQYQGWGWDHDNDRQIKLTY
jgi:hypothetical protein